MKKICGIILGLLLNVLAFAQSPEHTINVGRIDNFNHGALIITDSHYIEYFVKDRQNQIIGGKHSFALTWTPSEVNNNGYKDGLLVPGTVITSVNGISTEGMTPEQFYTELESKDSFSLGVYDRISGQTVTVYLDRISPIQNTEVREWIPVNIQNYQGYQNLDIYPQAYDFVGGLVSLPKILVRDIICREEDMQIEEYVDENFDFGLCNTFSIENPDNDAEQIVCIYLKKPLMKRVDGRGDLHFSVSKSVTPFSFVKYIAGVPLTESSNLVNLEIIARNRDDVVVWRLKGTSKTNSATRSPWDYMPISSWACIPPFDKIVVIERAYHKRCGIVQDEANPSVILYVEPGSRADRAGFLQGDIIIKAESEASYKKAYRSWGMTNGASGDYKDIKINLTSFPVGIFDDMTANWIQKDEYLPYLDFDGIPDNTFLYSWLRDERSKAKGIGWGANPGIACADVDWTVTVKRGNKKVKLVLPRAISEGHIKVSTSYIP